MTTRRDLLTGAAAVIAAPLLPLPAQAAAVGDAAIFALVERHQSLNASATEAGRIGDDAPRDVQDASEARVAEISDAMLDIECEVADASAGTVAGVLVKLKLVYSTFGVMPSTSAEDIFLSAVADLERLAAG